MMRMILTVKGEFIFENLKRYVPNHRISEIWG